MLYCCGKNKNRQREFRKKYQKWVLGLKEGEYKIRVETGKKTTKYEKKNKIKKIIVINDLEQNKIESNLIDKMVLEVEYKREKKKEKKECGQK